MRLPKRIKIGPHFFPIRKRKILERKKGIWGNASYLGSYIGIKKGLPKQHQAMTLVHEVCHLLFGEVSRFDLANDELFVDRFAQTLSDTLIHTPGLLEYLQSVKGSQ